MPSPASSSAPRRTLQLFAGAAALVAALGCGPLYGQATLTPGTQDFGSVVEGQSSGQFTFTFLNNSSTTDIINSVVVSPPSEFLQPPPGLCSPSGVVPAHTSCNIVLVFSPNATGPQGATLTVDSTDAVNPVLTSSLTGTGQGATTTATLTPGSWTFPSTAVGAYSSPEQFTLTNTGNTAIGNIQVGVSTNFTATPTCTSTLAAQASCYINVVFHPTIGGLLTGTLTVHSTSSSGTLTSSLTGTGISPVSGLTLSPYPALSMGSYELNAGSSPAVPVTLTNNDPTTITFSAPAGTGGIRFPVAGDFAQTNNCGQTLIAGASCTANITFAPTATGTRIGSLTVQSNASNGTQTLTLSGNGTDYTAATTTPSATVVQGSTANYSITFTPLSGYTNTITMGCSGLAAVGTSCTGNSTVFLGPAATVNFSITTTPKNLYGVIANGLVPNAGAGRTPWLITACSLLLLALAGRTRRLARAAGLLALLLGLLWPTGGCSGKQPTPDPDATQPGTYSFTFTAVDAAGDSKTLPLTLVVTSQ